MRAIVVAALVIIALLFFGWLQFRTPDGKPTIQVDTDKIKADTATVVDKAKGAVEAIDRRVDIDVDTNADSFENGQ